MKESKNVREEMEQSKLFILLALLIIIFIIESVIYIFISLYGDSYDYMKTQMRENYIHTNNKGEIIKKEQQDQICSEYGDAISKDRYKMLKYNLINGRRNYRFLLDDDKEYILITNTMQMKNFVDDISKKANVEGLDIYAYTNEFFKSKSLIVINNYQKLTIDSIYMKYESNRVKVLVFPKKEYWSYNSYYVYNNYYDIILINVDKSISDSNQITIVDESIIRYNTSSQKYYDYN